MWEAANFNWGGRYQNTKDGMHMEYLGTPTSINADLIKAKQWIASHFVQSQNVQGQPDVFPGVSHFVINKSDPAVTTLGNRLVATGFNKNSATGTYTPGPIFTNYDKLNVTDFQRAHSQLSGQIDGIPGPIMWQLLGQESNWA
jgi:hypothetical protein